MFDLIAKDPYDELFKKLVGTGVSEDEAEELLALVVENKNCDKIYELLNDTPIYDVCTLIYQTQEQFKKIDEIANELHLQYIKNDFA